MEAAFDNLKEHKKNNVNGIIEWMTEAKLIDGKTITEEEVNKLFSESKDEITLKKFKEKLAALAKEKKMKEDVMEAKLCGTKSAMSNAIEKLKQKGKNNVENMVQWMKDSKIVDKTKEGEEKARKILAQMKDKVDQVDLDKLKDNIDKAVDEKAAQLEELANSAEKGITGIMNAFGAASSAFKDAISKTKES